VISTVLPLPEDESEWGGLHIMFATCKGTVRRNSMDAFTNIPTAGKIAMKFGTPEDGEEEDITDRIIGVNLLTEEDDVLLATRNGPRSSTGRRRPGDFHVDPPPRRHHSGGARGLSPFA
jgi:DNA gyrase subunit A